MHILIDKRICEYGTIATGATEPIKTAIFKDSYPQVKQLHGIAILLFFAAGNLYLITIFSKAASLHR